MASQVETSIHNESTRRPILSEADFHRLYDISWKLSRQIIEITTTAGSGHPSSSLSAIDLLTGLYFGGILQYDAANPSWAGRDRFFMSKGHAAPGLYVTLAEAGYFNPELLSTLRKSGSPLEGHPVMHTLPGVEASTGSLGQGLSIGLGHALAGRLDGRNFRVFVMLGDGESDEGQVWEAAMAAAKYNLDHLTAVLDFNRYQQTGPVSQVMPSLLPIVNKWRSFGWETFEIDGHDLYQVMDAYQRASTVKDQPQIIIAHTKKGKGLSPFEKDPESHKHGVVLTPQEAQVALAELDQAHAQHGLEKAG
jgi:transketolase